MIRNAYSFPTDPTPVFHDGTGAPIYQWAAGHEPDDPADDCGACLAAPRGVCADHAEDLADSEAERWADGRRDER